MVNASIVVAPLFQMTFLFPKTFFGSVFIGTDAFDSESLAVGNTFGEIFWMTTLWEQVLVFIRRFVVYVKYHFHRECKHPDVNSGCFMSEFYSEVNIIGMVKEAMEVFFRIGPLHVIVVYETRPGKWLLV